MRIMFYQWEYPPSGSGIGRYAQHMAKALDDAGHEVFVVTSRVGETAAEEDFGNQGKIFRVFDVEEISSVSAAEKALKIAQRFQVEVIEVPDHLGEATELLKMRPRPKVIVKVHYNDVFPAARYAHMYYRWQRPLIDFSCWLQRKRLFKEKYSIEHADALIVPTVRVEHELVTTGIHLPDIRKMIPNPIPPMDRIPDAESSQPTLLLVGRVDIGKGIGYLPFILEQLVPLFPDLKIQIAGGDSYARFIGSTQQWFRKKLGPYEKHVEFLGWCNIEEMETAYQQAWVVITPSKWDTFPTAVLEAISRGKPVAASKHGGMPEMLEQTPAVVEDPDQPEFSEGLAALLSDKHKRQMVGEILRQRAQDVYHPEKIVREYIDWVRTVI